MSHTVCLLKVQHIRTARMKCILLHRRVKNRLKQKHKWNEFREKRSYRMTLKTENTTLYQKPFNIICLQDENIQNFLLRKEPLCFHFILPEELKHEFIVKVVIFYVKLCSGITQKIFSFSFCYFLISCNTLGNGLK